MPIAAKAMPTNQDGKLWRRRAGTAEVVTELLEAAGILGKAGDSHGDGEEAAEREQAEQD